MEFQKVTSKIWVTFPGNSQEIVDLLRTGFVPLRNISRATNICWQINTFQLYNLKSEYKESTRKRNYQNMKLFLALFATGKPKLRTFSRFRSNWTVKQVTEAKVDAVLPGTWLNFPNPIGHNFFLKCSENLPWKVVDVTTIMANTVTKSH